MMNRVWLGVLGLFCLSFLVAADPPPNVGRGPANQNAAKNKMDCPNQVKCPKGSTFEGFCNATLADCGVDAEKMRAKFTDCDKQNLKFCPDVEGCVPVASPCSSTMAGRPAGKKWCLDGTSPADGKCNTNTSRSVNGCDLSTNILCPDGVSCEKTAQKCAMHGQWDGPPPGKVSCAENANLFVNDPSECSSASLCSADTVECGAAGTDSVWRVRNGVNVSVLRPNCKPDKDCKVVSRLKPSEERAVFDGSKANELKVKATGAAATLLVKLVAAAGSFKIKGGAPGLVNFSVSAVPDSVMQFGSFRKLVARGLLASALVTISPDVDIELTGTNETCFAISLTFTNTNGTCAVSGRGLRGVVASDATSTTAEPEDLGICKKIENGEDATTCSCQLCAPHFSTYGLVYDPAAVSATATPSSMGSAAALRSSSWMFAAAAAAAAAAALSSSLGDRL